MRYGREPQPLWKRATGQPVMGGSHRAARLWERATEQPIMGESHWATRHGREAQNRPSRKRTMATDSLSWKSHMTALHVKERRGCPSQERATGAASNEIEPQATRHRRESQGQPIMGERLRGSPSAQGQPIMGERLRVSPSWERATEAARHGREPQGCSSRKRATGQPVIEKNHRLTRHWRELQGSPS